MRPTRLPVAHTPVALALLAIILSGLAVSGCGRRGGLEPPPSAAVLQTDEQGNVVESQEAQPDRPFVLDSLIQ